MVYFRAFVICLVINFVYIECNFTWNEDRPPLETDEIIVPAKIISNYVQKYAFPNKVFLSIIFSASNAEQEYFQKMLFKHLVIHGKLGLFTYNILNKFDQSQKRNKYAFHLIFIDQSDFLK